MASSLATVTIRRRLRYIRTRRTSPSRCRQELNSQIQEGTQRVETTRVLFSTQRSRWNTDRSLRTNVKQLYETIVRSNEMFKEINYVKTKDQQWYRVVPDACDVRKTRTQYMSVSRHIEFRCLDGGTRAKEQRISCECSDCIHHQERS